MAVVAAGAVIAAGYFVGARMGQKPVKVVAVAPAVAPVAPVASENTMISVRVTPADATIFLDGSQLLDNPARVSQARDGQPHSVRAVAPGHLPKDVKVALDGPTVSVDIALDPAPHQEEGVTARAQKPSAARPHGAPLTAPKPTIVPSVGHPRPPLDTTDPWQR